MKQIWKKKNYNLKNDLDYLEQLKGQIQNPCVKNRLSSRLEWYMISASHCEQKFYLCSIISILLPTLVLVVNTNLILFWNDILIHFIVGILSGITSVVSGLGALMKWHDNWVRYRASAEQLKSEATLYVAGAGRYSNAAKKDILFIYYIEKISLSENADWRKEEEGNQVLETKKS